MSRTVSVPTIQCHSYHPYHDRRRSGHPDILSGKSRYVEVPVHGADRLDLKVQLRNCLNSCKLTSMPLGFPFHTVRDSHGYSCISHESFEFREDLSGLSHHSNSRHQYATITFKNASPRDKTRYLTWQAHISADTPYLRNTHSKQPAAHVQVDPAVSQTPFWKSFINDPSVIMRALALSLELGALLTIQLADSRSRDAVVYTVTHKDGRQEPYFIVLPDTFRSIHFSAPKSYPHAAWNYFAFSIGNQRGTMGALLYLFSTFQFLNERHQRARSPLPP